MTRRLVHMFCSICGKGMGDVVRTDSDALVLQRRLREKAEPVPREIAEWMAEHPKRWERRDGKLEQVSGFDHEVPAHLGSLPRLDLEWHTDRTEEEIPDPRIYARELSAAVRNGMSRGDAAALSVAYWLQCVKGHWGRVDHHELEAGLDYEERKHRPAQVEIVGHVDTVH